MGNWSIEGEMKQSEMGPGGKMTSTEKCEWFEGRFSVVCHGQGQSPWGPGKSIGIMSYSPEEKAYVYYGVDTTGMTMTTVPRGTVKGDTWTYSDESMMGGRKVKTRVTMKELSPTAYTFKMEAQGPDGTWAPVIGARARRPTRNTQRARAVAGPAPRGVERELRDGAPVDAGRREESGSPRVRG